MEPIVLMGLIVVVYGGYVSWLDCRPGVATAIRRCMERRRSRQMKRPEQSARQWRGVYAVGLDAGRLCSRRRCHVPC